MGVSIELISAYSQYRFLPAGFFSYDAADEVINYDPDRLHKPIGKISLLHEISHCELGHFHYRFDIELLMMEVAAWHYTKKLAKIHGLKLDNVYIQDCIESYDNWVNQRGTCPVCNNFCIEQQENIFDCFVCNTRWQVSNEPQKRVVRKIILKNS